MKRCSDFGGDNAAYLAYLREIAQPGWEVIFFEERGGCYISGDTGVRFLLLFHFSFRAPFPCSTQFFRMSLSYCGVIS